MNKLPAPHRRSVFPELADLFEGFPSWAPPSWATLRPAVAGHLIRVEDEMKEGNYVLRAEIPGVDPAKDVDITVRDGVLTIKSERTEKKESNGRSEFSYGSFLRTVTLPAEANQEEITANYRRGILTVRVSLAQNPANTREIAIQNAGDDAAEMAPIENADVQHAE